MDKRISNALFALALSGAAFGAHAQSFDIGQVANKVVNSGAISSFTQTIQKQAQTPQVQAPQAKKTQQAPQTQQPQSELGAAGDQVLGGLGGLANGAGDVIGGTAKAGVAAVKTVATGISGFLSNITNQTPEFSVQNYKKIVESLDSSSKTEVINRSVKLKGHIEHKDVYVLTQKLDSGSEIKYGLTATTTGHSFIEVVGHPGLKSDENPNGYGKINIDDPVLSNQLIKTFKESKERNPNTPAVTTPSWESNSFGS